MTTLTGGTRPRPRGAVVLPARAVPLGALVATVLLVLHALDPQVVLSHLTGAAGGVGEELRSVGRTALGADGRWVAVAAAGSATSFVAAAAVTAATSPVRLPFRTAVGAQLAAAATRLVAPGAAGVVGVTARVMVRRGARVVQAATAAAAAQVAQLALTLVLLAAVLVVDGDGLGRAGRDLTSPAPGWWPAAVAVVVVLTVVAGAALPRPSHRLHGAARRLRAGARELRVTGRELACTLRRPVRAAALVLGATGLTAALGLSLWAATRAAGADAGVAAVLVVLLVGTTLGSVLPTPGGVGGVEGATVAGLVGVGLTLEQAVTAVLVHRLVTFWLPVPVGLVALVTLRRAGAL
ncbi:lysylphosphatidylglycerol synthase domain-containing protein [Thalassiella azotivora]